MLQYEAELEDLIEYILDPRSGFPVRPMEEILGHGAAAVEPLRVAARAAPSETDEPRLWPVVLLGELRDPRALPELTGAIAEASSDAITLPMAAAEALAKFGDAALPSLRSLAESGSQHQRLWAYYAAGRTRSDAALQFLLAALEADREMGYILGSALADLGRKEAIEPLLQALPSAEPWQRPELETALLELHGDVDPRRNDPEDWRIRYRWSPGSGYLPLNWAPISAIILGDEDVRAKRTERMEPLRSLDEILARGREAAVERCDCCGVPTWRATGVPVCPQTAGHVPLLQAIMLARVANEEGVDDLFDVLDVVEDRLSELTAGPEPKNRSARERRQDQRTEAEVLRAACIWLIGEGIENVGAGVVRLRREGERAAERFGTPLRSRPDRPAATSDRRPQAGRNDPCPCGSGRKFKKCCGTA